MRVSILKTFLPKKFFEDEVKNFSSAKNFSSTKFPKKFPKILGRVDSVNMHETGIHRFGFVQVRVPCRQAHFYHLRHSYKNIGVDEWKIDMENLAKILNKF